MVITPLLLIYASIHENKRAIVWYIREVYYTTRMPNEMNEEQIFEATVVGSRDSHN